MEPSSTATPGEEPAGGQPSGRVPAEAASEIYGVMSTLRAVRRLRADPIDEEVLERVIRAASWAPTGGNRQPWRVVVVRRSELKLGLQAIYEPAWKAYVTTAQRAAEDLVEPSRGKRLRSLAAGTYLAEHLGEAPVILMFCVEMDQLAVTDAHLGRPSLVAGGSVFPAVQNALLACRTEGLGCGITTLHCQREDEVKRLLGIPAGWGTAAMVPIGHPVGGGHGPISRRGTGDLAYADVFGAAWK